MIALILSLACAHSPVPDRTPPSVGATFHPVEKSASADGAPVWTFPIREGELRDLAGEAAWLRCRHELGDHWASCSFEIGPGLSLRARKDGPSTARIALADLGAPLRAAAKFGVYRDADGKSGAFPYAESSALASPDALPGPHPFHWGMPVFPSGGTLMRTTVTDADGIQEAEWMFPALPAEALTLVGVAGPAGCREAISKGWSSCGFGAATGVDVVVSQESSPALSLEPRAYGAKFRQTPRLTLHGQDEADQEEVVVGSVGS